MKTHRLFYVLLLTVAPCRLNAGEPAQQALVTNLVDILPYVERFAKTLDIDVPSPLTTNDVTRFPMRTNSVLLSLPADYGGVAGLRIRGRYQFVFEPRCRCIDTFTDYDRSMQILWSAEDIKPLIQPPKITKEQALQLARAYLAKLGYSKEKLPRLLPPEVHQWTWEPPGAPKVEPLPFFTVAWKWKKNPDMEYCSIEIDGFRQKVTAFNIMYTLHERDIPNP
jgi:hypothetical protein